MLRRFFGKPKKEQEEADGTPMEMPLGYKKPESLQAMMVRMLHDVEFQRRISARGMETIDEADDFELEDEDTMTPRTPYELEFDEETKREVLPAEKAMLDEARAAFDQHVKEKKKKAAIERAKQKAATKQEAVQEPTPKGAGR